MPVNHDELLARADEWAAAGQYYWPRHTKLVSDLAVALRAALAARPQPGPVDGHGFTTAEHDTLITLIDRNPERVRQMLGFHDLAVAGSATPTGDEWECEFCKGRGHHPDFVRHAHSCHALDPTFRRVAGSAIPTGDE